MLLLWHKLKCINTDWLSGEWEADDEWNAADLQSVWWIYVKVDPQDTSRNASGCVAVHLHAFNDM